MRLAPLVPIASRISDLNSTDSPHKVNFHWKAWPPLCKSYLVRCPLVASREGVCPHTAMAGVWWDVHWFPPLLIVAAPTICTHLVLDGLERCPVVSSQFWISLHIIMAGCFQAVLDHGALICVTFIIGVLMARWDVHWFPSALICVANTISSSSSGDASLGCLPLSSFKVWWLNNGGTFMVPSYACLCWAFL